MILWWSEGHLIFYILLSESGFTGLEDFQDKTGEGSLGVVPFGTVPPNISFSSELYRNRALHQKELKSELYESII